jgi:hypothetical protein
VTISPSLSENASIDGRGLDESGRWDALAVRRDDVDRSSAALAAARDVAWAIGWSLPV